MDPSTSNPLAARPSAEAPLEAAFFDVDGTIVRTNLVHLYAYYAFNTGSIAETARRAAGLFASIPLWWAVDKVSRRKFNEAFFKSYKGLSIDRLEVLSRELFDEVLKDALFPKTLRLIEGARAQGAKIVIVTGALDFSIRPLADYVGADDLIANRMEFVRHKATGRVVPPLVEGASKAAHIRTWAEKHGVNLSRCAAYTDSWSDYPMLAIVGHPTAVSPDLRLRAAANRYRWPIVEVKE